MFDVRLSARPYEDTTTVVCAFSLQTRYYSYSLRSCCSFITSLFVAKALNSLHATVYSRMLGMSFV